MSNQINVFQSEQFGDVRTVVRDGEPWFVAADVCKALSIGNASDALSRLDFDEKMTIGLTEGHSGVRGGAQSLNIVNEPGLYTLVLSSRKPEAKAFKRWITHDVIPAIRKTGSYIMGEQKIQDDDELIQLGYLAIMRKLEQREAELEAAREKSRKLQEDVANRDAYIDAIEPKADYCQKILEAPEALAVTVIAKDYGMTAQRFNKLLHDKHVQYKCNGEWVLYKEYADKGYTKSETILDKNGYLRVMNKWTQSGRMFLYHLLKDEGIMPVVA